MTIIMPVEQLTRIELAPSAWKAEVLPLNYNCILSSLTTSLMTLAVSVTYMTASSYSSLSQGHFSRKIEQHSPVKYTARLF